MTKNIDLRQIETDDDLAKVLKSLGFESQKNLWTNSILCERKLTSQPQRIILAQDNNLESHAVVIANNGVLYLYYYDESDDLFKEWIRLSGEVHPNLLRDNLNTATTLEGIKKRFATQ